MSRIPYNPETGSHCRLNMCFACIHGFHLSCHKSDCTCFALNHSSEQSAPIPQPAGEAQDRAQASGEAIAS